MPRNDRLQEARVIVAAREFRDTPLDKQRALALELERGGMRRTDVDAAWIAALRGDVK